MKGKITAIIEKALGKTGSPVELSVPEEDNFGHYSSNIAMRAAKAAGKNPLDLARELAEKIASGAPAGFFEKVEAVPPGFINFWLSKETLAKMFREAVKNEHFGKDDDWKGKKVMVEFTDPNPFKLFHIGHLMSNTIGESFARFYENAGAHVIRANYQGDVGMHVAKAIWGMEHVKPLPADDADLAARVKFLGEAYAAGAKAYEESEPDRHDIAHINEQVYSRADHRVNTLYDRGRKWSLDYFETVYARLGTKFDEYFFESEVGKDGLALVRAHQDVFQPSDGAIVFRGEEVGLHTRVFVNAQGLPTYEAKELGLNKRKFEKNRPDLSIIVTGNEVVDYFKVVLRVMGLIMPEVAERTRHVAHGMLRLPSGKMSSRTGSVITAEWLFDQLKERLGKQASERSDLSSKEREEATEAIAIGAVKYSILKQNPGADIVFDFEKSLSTHGDSGPYLQYAYARLKSILRKAEEGGHESASPDFAHLDLPIELALMRKILEFPDITARARESYTPSTLATYLFKLTSTSNKFYETTPILKDENAGRRAARLALVAVSARTIKDGLALLGMQTLEKI